MSYVNQINADPISVNEVIPFTITIRELISTDANVISYARRYDEANKDTTGTNVFNRLAISGNRVTVNNIFDSTESPRIGSYRLWALIRDPGSITKVEFNYMIKVIHS